MRPVPVPGLKVGGQDQVRLENEAHCRRRRREVWEGYTLPIKGEVWEGVVPENVFVKMEYFVAFQRSRDLYACKVPGYRRCEMSLWRPLTISNNAITPA